MAAANYYLPELTEGQAYRQGASSTYRDLLDTAS